jgi:hypothetical protein
MDNSVSLTDAQKKAQKSRSLAIGLALVAFVLILYFSTFYKIADIASGQ